MTTGSAATCQIASGKSSQEKGTSLGITVAKLVVGWQKQSESEATWALSPRMPFQPPLMAGAGGFFAPHIREYIRRSRAPDHVGIKVAVKDRRHALKNPYAHLHQRTVCFEEIRDTPMLWDPIRLGETCPSSDGACAMVLASEKLADHVSARPAWIHATEMRSVLIVGRTACPRGPSTASEAKVAVD